MITSIVVAAALFQSQAPKFSVEDSSAHTPQGMMFWAGYARSDAGDWVVEIYTRRHEGRGEYVLRRALNTPAGREQVQWATSASCPVALNIVPAMGRLSLGDLTMPPLERPPQPWFDFPQMTPSQPDSVGYALWGRGRQPDGAMAQYRVTTGGGLLGGFVDHAEAALKPCWTEELH